MQTIILTGKVYDGLSGRVVGGDYEGIPSPKIQITDKDGNLTSGKYQAMGDISGNFKLEIPAVIKRGKYITVSNALDKRTIPLIDGKNSYNIDMGMKVQGTQDEVIVTANPDQVNCIRSKGQWNAETKVCTMPSQPKKKMPLAFKILIGLGILAVIGGGVYLATRKSKGK